MIHFHGSGTIFVLVTYLLVVDYKKGCDGAGVNASDFHFDIPGSNPALVKDIF